MTSFMNRMCMLIQLVPCIKNSRAVIAGIAETIRKMDGLNMVLQVTFLYRCFAAYITVVSASIIGDDVRV